MRVYETAHDHCVLPGRYMVVRLDGRCFSRLIRHHFPDPRAGAIALRDHLVATVEERMGCDVRGLPIDAQYLLMREHDIDIDEHSAWLKRGIGFY